MDGWWAEGFDREVGWAIGHGENYANEEYQDAVESEALYNLLEQNVAPLLYERDHENLPRRWIAKMKSSMKRLCPVFNTNRMVREYAERFYLPTVKRYSELAAEGVRDCAPSSNGADAFAPPGFKRKSRAFRRTAVANSGWGNGYG